MARGPTTSRRTSAGRVEGDPHRPRGERGARVPHRQRRAGLRRGRDRVGPGDREEERAEPVVVVGRLQRDDHVPAAEVLRVLPRGEVGPGEGPAGAVDRSQVKVRLDHTQFLAHFFKCSHCFFEVFTGMGGRELHADARLAFRDHGIVETDHIDSFSKQL